MTITSLLNSPITSGATAVYAGKLVDESGNPITSAQLATLTLSIVDTFSKAIINNVSQVNIFNTDRGTIDSQGNLTITLNTTDTTVSSSGDSQDYRSLIIDWTYNNPAKTGRHQVNLLIQNLSGP